MSGVDIDSVADTAPGRMPIPGAGWRAAAGKRSRAVSTWG
jgi:hypothetical protein